MSNILQTLWHKKDIKAGQMQMEMLMEAKLASGNFCIFYGLLYVDMEPKHTALKTCLFGKCICWFRLSPVKLHFWHGSLKSQ